MKATLPKSDLSRLLKRCVGVCDKKSTMPVLSCVLLTAGAETLAVNATDLVLAVTGDVGATVREAGSVAVLATEFLKRVEAMPDGDVTLAVKGTEITLSAGKRKFKLSGLPAADYPKIQAPPTEWLDADRETLLSLIDQTHFSISTDVSRVHLNSLLLEFDGSVARAVSTDGHRLSLAEAPCDLPKQSLLIPLKGVTEIRKLLDKAGKDSKLQLAREGDSLFVSIDGFTLSVKLTDAVFPPYQQVIPNGTEFAAPVPASLREVLKAVSVVASERTGGVKLGFGPGSLLVAAECAESGTAADELALDYEGMAVDIGVNARYLIDALNAVDVVDCQIGFGRAMDPVLIRADEGRFTGVIMPMRLT